MTRWAKNVSHIWKVKANKPNHLLSKLGINSGYHQRRQHIMTTRTLMQRILTAGFTFFTLLHRMKCNKITDINVAKQWLMEHNIRTMEVYSRAVAARWNYNTNLTDFNQKRAVSINFKCNIEKISISFGSTCVLNLWSMVKMNGSAKTSSWTSCE